MGSCTTPAAAGRRPVAIDTLEVILKTVERCNIACRYCYFFFGGDTSYERHPPCITRATVNEVAGFLKAGAVDLGIDKLQIDFHGGEPLMQKLCDFDWMCTQLRETLGDVASLTLSLQTNAMLVSDSWIELFHKHQIGVGVSIDGPEQVHDSQRVDHRGRGTHARVITGLERLTAARRRGYIPWVGALCVIDPEQDPAALFAYFLHDLQLDDFQFITPHPPLASTSAQYGKFLCGLFDAWTEHGDPAIRLRVLNTFFGKLRGVSSFLGPSGPDPVTHRVIKIASDGTLHPDDVLHDSRWWTPHVGAADLRSFLDSEYFREVDGLHLNPPRKCRECCWLEACQGGHPWHRYRAENGFDNPSSLCEGLQRYYGHCTTYLLRNGTPLTRILSQLKLDVPAS